MWPRFITSLSKKEKEMKKMKTAPCKSLNVNDEYLHAVRTKSFADFFVKVSMSEPNLLEPGQEAIATILESYLFSSKPSHHHRLKSLLFNYFDVSAESSSFCTHLLKTLEQLQSDHRCLHRIIDAIDDHSSEQISELRSCIVLDSATLFSSLDFSHIHDKHSSVLQKLKSSRKRVARKIKVIRLVNRASGVCVTAACGLVAAAAMFLAMHTLTALLLGPAIFSLPIKPLKNKIGRLRLMKYGFLRKIVEQLDVAAKGAYILNRDFDTMGRLVGRLQDEIEHKKAMIRFCLDRSEDRMCVQVLKELIMKYEFGFSRQVEEVEEHVYLCLVTINRARAMVLNEIATTINGHIS